MSFIDLDDQDPYGIREREEAAILAEEEKRERDEFAVSAAFEAGRIAEHDRCAWTEMRAIDPDGMSRAADRIDAFHDCAEYPRRRWLPNWLRLRLAARDIRREDEAELGPLPAPSPTRGDEN